MKKILASLLVLALCAPAMAATVAIVDNADGTATITVTAAGTDNIVGLGLDIDVTGGNATACTVDTATFDIFPDAAHDLEVATPGSYTYGAGTPIANQLTVGKQDPITNSFCVSVGALNGAAIPGATGSASVQITLTVDADSTVCVKENALRGGIVLTTGVGEDITNGDPDPTIVCGAVTVGGDPECFSSAAGQKYTDWLAFGSPDCWCYQRQCRGDADGASEGSAFFGIKWVFNNDLNLFLTAYGVLEAPKGLGILSVANGICADFDHAAEGSAFFGIKRVFNNDLNIFLASYNVAEPTKGPGVPVCPLTTAGGDIVFYTN